MSIVTVNGITNLRRSNGLVLSRTISIVRWGYQYEKRIADDPFAEEPVPSSEESEQTEENNEGGSSMSDNTTLQSIKSESRQKTDTDDTSSDHSISRVLPYIYKRDAVKEDRTQRPVYLREYNEARITELVADVEGCLGEEITKTDLLEAAMETAIENPQLVADILRTERYGYDWE